MLDEAILEVSDIVRSRIRAATVASVDAIDAKFFVEVHSGADVVLDGSPLSIADVVAVAQYAIFYECPPAL